MSGILNKAPELSFTHTDTEGVAQNSACREIKTF